MALTRVVVGRIGKPHGIRGEVTIEVRTDEPDLRFAAGSLVFAEGTNRKFKVESTRWHSGTLLIMFADFADRTRAEAARGTILEAEVDELDLPVEEDEFYDRQLIGLAVIEAGSKVGKLVDVSHLPSQDLLVIKLEDGTEMLLPFVEQFVPVVNLAEGFIEIAPPDGLLEEPDED